MVSHAISCGPHTTIIGNFFLSVLASVDRVIWCLLVGGRRYMVSHAIS